MQGHDSGDIDFCPEISTSNDGWKPRADTFMSVMCDLSFNPVSK